MVCSPIGKNTALVQLAASAARTSAVLCGQGPSSKVSTTSPGCRKSYCLKCSKPKPGPPVVSISTTRDTPSASGWPGQLIGAGCGAGAGAAGGAIVGTGAGAACAMADVPAGAIAGAAGATAAGPGSAVVTTVCAGLDLVVAAVLAVGAAFAAGAGAAAGADATTGE